jgi:hypothetical protein
MNLLGKIVYYSMDTQDYKRAFIKDFKTLCYRRQAWQVFHDFCTLTALALQQVFERNDEREKEYLATVERYEPDEVTVFPKLLSYVVGGLSGEPCDFLGSIFQELGLASHWHGQIFTPISVAMMVAQLTFSGVEDIIDKKGFITANEPVCGAGAMAVAAFHVIKQAGYNPQKQLHITAIDVDETAAKMCFIQLCLLGCPAKVYIGNTITQDMRCCMLTTMHHLGFWNAKLRTPKRKRERLFFRERL